MMLSVHKARQRSKPVFYRRNPWRTLSGRETTRPATLHTPFLPSDRLVHAVPSSAILVLQCGAFVTGNMEEPTQGSEIPLPLPHMVPPGTRSLALHRSPPPLS